MKLTLAVLAQKINNKNQFRQHDPLLLQKTPSPTPTLAQF